MKKKKDELGKHTKIILKKMHKAVGADFKDFDNKPNWYLKHSWMIEDEQNFQEWMVDYLYKNTEARNEIMAHPIKRKGDIRKACAFFLLDFGWKIQ